MPDAVEPPGQHMDEEAPDELVSGKGHGFVPGTSLGPVVFPLEGNAVLIERDQSAVGDGDPVGIACAGCRYR